MRLSVCLAIVALLSSTSTRVLADERSNHALAEAMFREGRALLEAGKVNVACEKLAGSYRLDARIGTLANLAACHEMEGKLATAWADFIEVARSARASEAPGARELEVTARRRAAELEQRLFRLTLDVSEPASDLVLALDGRELPFAARQTPLPVDPGPHTLSASRPGFQRVDVRVDVPKEPGTRRVTIPALVPSPTVSKKPPLATEAEPSRGSVPPYVWAGGAVAVLAVGAGTFFGVRAMSAMDDRDAACPGGRCTSEGLARQDDAFAAATASTVSFAVAGAAVVVTGLALFLRPRPSVKASPVGATGTWRF